MPTHDGRVAVLKGRFPGELAGVSEHIAHIQGAFRWPRLVWRRKCKDYHLHISHITLCILFFTNHVHRFCEVLILL